MGLSTTSTDRGDVPRPLDGSDAFTALVAVALGLVVPLLAGVSTPLVFGTFLAGVLIGVAVCLLPSRVRLAIGAILVLAGVAVCVGVTTLLGLTWLCAAGAGVGFGPHLVNRPRSGGPVATAWFRASWDTRSGPVTVDSPTPEQVSDAVRALDGTDHTVVSVFRGPARLDVVGDARSAVLVLQSDDHEDHRTHWHHVTSPREADREEPEVEVAVAGVTGHFRRHQTTTAENALVAVEHFLTTGDRTPRLEWHGGRDVVAMRAPLGES